MINNQEDVNGMVIGSVTRTYTLHSPNGTQEGNPGYFESYSEAVAWAKQRRETAIAEVGPSVAKFLGWNGEWELREGR